MDNGNNSMYDGNNGAQNGAFSGSGQEERDVCGTAPDDGHNYDSQGYQGCSGQNYGNGGQYQYPCQGGYPQGGYERELEEPVTMGEWMVSLLLITFVPCVNIILMFVWAFSKNEKKSKSNFFKAQLIISGIMLAVYALLFMVFGVYFFAAL